MCSPMWDQNCRVQEVSSEVDRRIKQASKAFGSLPKVVFADRDLSLKTKRKMYVPCVLSVLLYRAVLRRDKKKLNSSSQLYLYHLRDHKPATVETTHNITRG